MEPKLGKKSALRRDTIVWSDLYLYQAEKGYHFNRDSIVLARSLETLHGKRVVDLGTGCGVMPLVALRSHLENADYHSLPFFLGIEIQESLVECAKQNAILNGFENHFVVNHLSVVDVPQQLPRACFDLAICNPPYYPIGSGKVCLDESETVARHEVKARLKDFVAGAAHLLIPGGAFVMILPAFRQKECTLALEQFGFGAAVIREIHPNPNAPAKLIWLKAVYQNSWAVSYGPSIFFRDNCGEATAEMKRYFGESKC